MTTPAAAAPEGALADQIAALKQFLTDHPEVAAALGGGPAADAGPPVPLTFADVVHTLIDALPLHGADQERRDQYHAVVDEHLAPPPAAPDATPDAAAAAPVPLADQRAAGVAPADTVTLADQAAGTPPPAVPTV